MNFCPETGRQLRKAPQAGVYPPYHPVNQAVDNRIGEFRDEIMAAIRGQQEQAPLFDMSKAAEQSQITQSSPFISVSSQDEALAYKAADGVSWVQGTPIHFYNTVDKEFYKTWFDATASPSHCIEVYKLSSASTPNILPITQEMPLASEDKHIEAIEMLGANIERLEKDITKAIKMISELNKVSEPEKEPTTRRRSTKQEEKGE